MCRAYTPESKIKAVTLGFERRYKPGPRGGRWVLGLAGGWIDVEWNGIQLHKGMVPFGLVDECRWDRGGFDSGCGPRRVLESVPIAISPGRSIGSG